ncbi:unnamed protein product [Dovyalis caffra]|uniref:Ribosomal protein L5 n=1 Tax=Dovyalis caffra TaxID=77055 RepID=A0AAV1R7J2_9ROSI|nr:unnamed protein product [Dovyalis caffra]
MKRGASDLSTSASRGSTLPRISTSRTLPGYLDHSECFGYYGPTRSSYELRYKARLCTKVKVEDLNSLSFPGVASGYRALLLHVNKPFLQRPDLRHPHDLLPDSVHLQFLLCAARGISTRTHGALTSKGTGTAYYCIAKRAFCKTVVNQFLGLPMCKLLGIDLDALTSGITLIVNPEELAFHASDSSPENLRANIFRKCHSGF